MKTFVRDVIVNVLANLIAVAIIYLLGTMVGLFPQIAEAVKLAVTVILLASFAVLVVAAISRLRLRPQRSAYLKSLYVSAIAGIACGISVAAVYLLVPRLPVFDRITGTIGGIAFALLMVAVIGNLRHQRGLSRAAAARRERESSRTNAERNKQHGA